MKVRFMQFIDYWVGVPICVLISIWDFIIGKRFFSQKSPIPRKALFIELSEMGTAVLSYSSLYQFKHQFKNTERFFLIFDSNAESVELLNEIPKDNILTIKNESFLALTISTFVTLLRIRKLKIDTVIDMELFSRFTSILSYLSGASNRVGFYQFTGEGLYRGKVLTHPVSFNPNHHISINLLSLIFSLKENPNEVPLLKKNILDKLSPLPKYKITTEETSKTLDLLRQINPAISNRSSIIVVNGYPGELLPIRGWPVNYYQELVKQLLDQDQKLFIILTGVTKAAKFNQQIESAAANDRCINFTSKTKSLKDLISLIELAKVLVTTDGGPAHFASLTNIHSVVLFGPVHPDTWGPIGDKKTIIYSNLSCSPCLTAHNHRHSICIDNQCTKTISVAQVSSTVLSAYQGSS
jgi:ADP-heptose:LPS heptosyltransferase